MPNQLLTSSIIASEALLHLEDQLVIANIASRDKTGEFTANAKKVGDTVDIRTEPEYSVNEFTAGGSITTQDVRNSKRPFTIEKHFDASIKIGAREAALDLDSVSEQIIRPATYKIAERIDTYLGTKILQGRGMHASANLFSTVADIANARKTATEQQLGADRFALVNLALEAKLLGQDYFHQSQIRGGAGVSALDSANMGHLMGMDFISSINMPVQNNAAGAGTSITDNGAGANNLVGASVLTIDSLTNQIEVGDRIAIAGVRRPLVVAAQAVATATTVTLVDPIDEIIPDNAALTVVGSGSAGLDIQGAIFDGSSLAFAMPALEIPPASVDAAVASNNGFSIRVVSAYDLLTKTTIWSLDVLVGAVAWDTRKVTLLAQIS